MADRGLPMPSTGRRRPGAGTILLGLAGLLILVILITPVRDVGRTGNPRLTTYSAEPQGARGFYEIVARLGWLPARQRDSVGAALDSNAVYAVLYPVVPLGVGEVHRLLEGVRAGASLLVVIQNDRALADSLRLRHTSGGGRMMAVAEASRAGCEGVTSGGTIDWPGGRPYLWGLVRRGPLSPAGDTTFLRIRGLVERADTTVPPPADSVMPAVLGFTMGRGRVVAISDPDLLRNDVVRTCRWGAGVLAVRLVEWLSARPGGTPRARVVFDEYHQGYGSSASTSDAIWRFLSDTAPGRVLLALVAGALLWIAARAPRPLTPLARSRLERRSPLEHVGALSRAYEQIGATRLATRRLARGVRRRHAHGAWRQASDELFLESVAARHPVIAAEVQRVLDAMRRPLAPADFVLVGRAIESIERTLHQT